MVWEKMTNRNEVFICPLDMPQLIPFQNDQDSIREYPDSPELRTGNGRFPPLSTPTPQRDLSNLKLAQNQTELSGQISELRATVEMQGKMLARLLEVLEVQGEGGGSNLVHKGKSRQT
jgi:hypothetical protein